MADRIGQQVGNYRLINLLGQGSFANVYLAKHLYLETQAAIKILHTRLTGNDRESFRTEARRIAHLDHPHIVQVLGFDVEEGIPYLVMDYAPHGTLLQRYPKGSRLQLATLIQYVKQVADALQYAHDRKVIHRDVKSENMLIGRKEEILLSDFGIAMLAQSSLEQPIQKVAGTIGYMAPEQIQGKPCFASDQYALGVVVYEWICGERPFKGSFTEITAQHLLTPPPPLLKRVPTLPPGAQEIVLKALAKDPSQRFADVQAFASALEQAIPSESVVLYHSSDILAPGDPSPKPIDSSASNQSLFSTLVVRPPSQVRSKHSLSRRAIVIGIAGLAGVSIAGGSLFLMRSHAPFSSTAISPPATRIPSPTPTATPTPPPLGTLRLTHVQSSSVSSVAWSPDGKSIASGDTQTVQVWNATTGNTLLTHPDGGYKLGWSPNGKTIASTDGGRTAQVWDTFSGNTIVTYQGHSARLWDITWSPDSARIASASNDRTVQIWDATTGATIFTFHGHPTPVYTVAWSPDGQYIASCGDYNDRTLRVWNSSTGTLISTAQAAISTGNDPVTALAWSPGNSFSIESGSGYPVTALVWSPDSKYVAISILDGTVRIWDVMASRYAFVYAVDPRLGGMGVVAWSPDGKWIAAEGGDRTVHIFDAVTGNRKYIYHGYSSGVCWSPHSTLIASGGDSGVQVWQAM